MLPLILDSRSFSNNPLVSNLPPITSTSAGYSITSTQWLTTSFTTGDNSFQYILSSVSLRSAQISSSPNWFVDLYPSNPGLGGTRLVRFINPTNIPNTTANNLFTLTVPLLLPANTTYWLVTGISSGSGQYLWAFTNSNIASGVANWSIGNTCFASYNQGGTWSLLSENQPFQFSVNGENY